MWNWAWGQHLVGGGWSSVHPQPGPRETEP